MNEIEAAPRSRPVRVSRAILLLYLAVGIGAVRVILGFFTPGFFRISSAGTVIGLLLLTATLSAIECFVIYKIGSGRNWARIVFLLHSVVAVPYLTPRILAAVATLPVINVLGGVLGIFQVAAAMVALVMVFQPGSNAWFRRPKPA